MRIKLRSKFTLLFMTFALLLAVPAVALADRLDADADTFATATPAANDMTDIEQQLGTTKTYPFSAAVQNTGGDNNTVNAFRSPSTSFPNDKVTVTNNFSGAWVDQAGSGPASFEITAYNQNHQGNISIAVPCDAEIGTPATMTVELSAVASNTTANLNGATQTVNYTITPTGTPDENECTPADTTAPDPPSTPDLDAASDSGSSDTDNVTNDNKPDFSGTAEANSTVELFADATSLGTTTADASGNWSFDGASILTSALADDTYSITAKATDASNNTSGASGALSVTIDTVANAPTGLDLTTDTGTSPTDDITNDKTPTIEGSAEANGSVELFEGTTSLGTGSANNSGAWSITSGTLTDGQHTLKAQVTDVTGNVSALSSGLVVTIDTVNPVVSFVNASAFSGNPSFDFGSVPPAPTCSATDTGGSGVDGTCQVGGYDTAVGNYTLTATANDIAGNEGAATPLTYSVLAAKPTASISQSTWAAP